MEISQGSWLFTRGSQSVRLVREGNVNGFVRLFISGPEQEAATHEFTDVSECMKRQAAIEQNLLAAGYQLAPRFSDRRYGQDTWNGPDRRRVTTDIREGLFWSRRGEVACGSHAPDPNSERWQAERWSLIPASANGRHGLAYQCPHCAPDGRSHRHMHPGERDRSDLVRSA